MGMADVHDFSHMLCSKLDIGLNPEITFVLYYETRLEVGQVVKEKLGESFRNKKT